MSSATTPVESTTLAAATFHGKEFYFLRTPVHASWWSFADEKVIRDKFWNVQPGDTVLDIGASFGSYTLPSIVSGGKVYAFCLPPDCDLLRANLAINNFGLDRCVVMRYGLANRRGYIHNVRCSLHDTPADDRTEVKTLTDFMDEHPEITKLDWIKLDVEGAETDILAEAARILYLYQPQVFVEFHAVHGKSTKDAVCEIFRNLRCGYQVLHSRNHESEHGYFFIGGKHR